MAFERDDVLTIAERVNARLARSDWDTRALETNDVDTAAEVAVFALELAGKRRQARRGGRFGRLVVSFALAACVALSAIAAACDKPDATGEETQTAIAMLPSLSASQASITAQPRASPAEFTDMVLLDAGSDSSPWAVLQASGSDSPVLVDRVGSGLDTVGMTYRLAAQPVTVGTRDGTAQFLDPLQPATSTGTAVQPASNAGDQLEQRWAQDERFLAPTRAIAGQPSVLDAAYNGAAAAAAGGAHTYLNGVVLRAEPDQPVLSVIDKALLESGTPTRAEDVVYVALPQGQQSQYNPGQVINLRDVAISQQKTDVDGQPSTVNVINAALDGSRIEPVGSVDLQSLLQPRLQRVDQDLGGQAQAGSAATGTPVPAAAATPVAGTQPIIVQQQRGPSFVDDFLIWMWLSNSSFYRGPSVIINNPPPSSSRSTDQVYYSPPPTPSGSTPSTVASSQSSSRSTALEAARSSVSGQSAGTGGGIAATNKAAADSSARVSAATAKSAAVAGAVAASSVGKSISSVPSSSSSSTASRSAGLTSAGTRGSAGVSSSSSGSKGIGGGSVSSGGSKGIGGSSGGFGGGGSSSSSSS